MFKVERHDFRVFFDVQIQDEIAEVIVRDAVVLFASCAHRTRQGLLLGGIRGFPRGDHHAYADFYEEWAGGILRETGGELGVRARSRGFVDGHWECCEPNGVLTSQVLKRDFGP